MQDVPQKVKVEDLKTTLFVRDDPQKVKGEDVKAKLSCNTSLKKKMGKMKLSR